MHVLIVDDEVLIGKTLSRALSRDYSVVNVDSAVTARELLEEDHHFDLILCDLMMPHMTGMDLYDWMLEHQPELAGRTVFMTGGTYTDRAQELIAKPGVRFVEKPFEMTRLRALLSSLLQAA